VGVGDGIKAKIFICRWVSGIDERLFEKRAVGRVGGGEVQLAGLHSIGVGYFWVGVPVFAAI